MGVGWSGGGEVKVIKPTELISPAGASWEGADRPARVITWTTIIYLLEKGTSAKNRNQGPEKKRSSPDGKSLRLNRRK